MKVNLCDKKLRKQFERVLGIINTILGLIVIFADIPSSWKKNLGIGFIILLITIYIILLLKANHLNKINMVIDQNNVEILYGDIWEYEQLKVIPFNEYFDTKVDDKLISKKSLNGQMIQRYKNNISKLNNLIDKSERYIEKNNYRATGKKNKFKLGTLFEFKDCLILAFSRFNESNEAYLSREDYIQCLFNMWNEISRIYNQRDIVIPLLGSGITRFEGQKLSNQELLEIILITLKYSNIKISHANKIKIILPKDLKDEIDLYGIEVE